MAGLANSFFSPSPSSLNGDAGAVTSEFGLPGANGDDAAGPGDAEGVFGAGLLVPLPGEEDACPKLEATQGSAFQMISGEAGDDLALGGKPKSGPQSKLACSSCASLAPYRRLGDPLLSGDIDLVLDRGAPHVRPQCPQ